MDDTTAVHPGLARPVSAHADSTNPALAHTFSSEADSPISEDFITTSSQACSNEGIQMFPSTKGTGILKGTGPELVESSSHRSRPNVTYNLKELSDKTRAPSRPPGDVVEQSVQGSQQPVEYTASEPQPAKRRRVDDDSTRPQTLGSNEPAFETAHPTAAPSHFNTELLDYIWPILLDGGINNPMHLLESEFFRPYISLPKVRDVQWNLTTKRSKWTYRTKVDIIALLVQLTGIPSPHHCTKCDPLIGLWIGCIVTSSEVLAKTYYGCANCLYHGTQTYCSLKDWSQKRLGRIGARCSACNKAESPCQECLLSGRQRRYPEDDKKLASAQTTSSKNGNSTVIKSLQPAEPYTAKYGTVTFTKPLQYGQPYTTNNGHQQQSAPPAIDSTTEPHQILRDWAPSVPVGLQGHAITPTRINALPQKQHENGVPLSGVAAQAARGTGPDDASKLAEIPSMEKWERAPGRIRSRASGQPTNIAYSKSYLASGVEVQICREATFKIELIRSGHTHSIKAEDGVTRICSIATAGKLNVKLDNEEPIVIGPHGMFTVRPRSSCFVESEVYEEVALHITTVQTG